MHIVLWFCFLVLRIVYPMLPVSLDWPVCIASSVIFNVYFQNVLSILHEINCIYKTYELRKVDV
jgi:hypothetical protein